MYYTENSIERYTNHMVIHSKEYPFYLSASVGRKVLWECQQAKVGLHTLLTEQFLSS